MVHQVIKLSVVEDDPYVFSDQPVGTDSGVDVNGKGSSVQVIGVAVAVSV